MRISEDQLMDHRAAYLVSGRFLLSTGSHSFDYRRGW